MMKFKAKRITALLVVCCFVICLGFSTAKNEQNEIGVITANAETTYTEYNVSDLTVFRWLIFKLCCCQRGRRDFHRRYVCE